MRRILEQAARGLVYSSESDRPFEFVDFSGATLAPGEALTVARFSELAGVVAPGERVEERELDRFFARHLETSDPYDVEAQRIRPRYEALKATLQTALENVRVFRVGRVEVRCYVLGRAPDGAVCGLVTVAVET
jgi:hypothetical protein